MTYKDDSKVLATGEVHDTIKFVEDGEFQLPNGEIITGKAGETVKLPVVHNLILYSFPKLIAALIKGEEAFFKNLWWEVGSGSDTWKDTELPNPQLTDEKLLTPTFRKAIALADIKYLNPTTNEVTTDITNKLQVECTFSPTEANGPLREFSIYMGGNQTLGSGMPINRKIHGIIFKSTGIELQRQIHFQFNI